MTGVVVAGGPVVVVTGGGLVFPAALALSNTNADALSIQIYKLVVGSGVCCPDGRQAGVQQLRQGQVTSCQAEQ